MLRPQARLALALAVPAALAAAPAAVAQAVGRTLFVVNNGNLEGSVTALAIAPDGTLSVINRVVTGRRPNTNVPCPGCNPYEVALTPSGRYLATGHASTNDPFEQITIFTVAADGSISQTAAFSVPGTPMDLTWVSDSLLLATRTDTSAIVLYEWVPAGPSLIERDVEYAGTFCTYVVKHPTGPYVYANDTGAARGVRAYRIEPDNTLTLIDTEPTGSRYALELAITPDGTKLYAPGGITQVVSGWSINPDGTLTPLAGSPFPAFGNSPANVACTPDGAYLFVGHGTDATVRSAAINPVTGGLTPTGAVFDVGLQGTLGDVALLDNLLFVTDNSTALDGLMGVYSFTVHANGSFTPNGPIVSTEGIAPRSIATWKPPGFRPGDTNCDGVVNFDDIDPFVLALSGQAAYDAQYPDCDWLTADCNGDGFVDFDDIAVFVGLIGN